MTERGTTKGAYTRSRILAAARRALIARGYGGLVMREVAAACDMKLGNVQYYFATRDALVEQVIRAEARLDLDAIPGEHLDNPVAALEEAVAELHRNWRGESGVVFATLTALALHDEVFRELRKEIYARFYAHLQPILRAIDPEQSDAEHAIRARLITALVDGAPMQTGVAGTPAFIERVQTLAVEIAGAETCPRHPSNTPT